MATNKSTKHLKSWWFCCAVILFIAAALRWVGLDRFEQTSDEGHYRTEMLQIQLHPFWSGDKNLRDHSIRHTKGNAAHPMGAQFFYYQVRDQFRRFEPRFTQFHLDSERMDNLRGRVGPFVFGVGIVVVMLAFGRLLFGPFIGLLIGLSTALSPNTVLWSRSEYLDVAMTFFLMLGWLLIWLMETSNRKSIIYQVILSVSIGVVLGCALSSKWSAALVIPFQFLWFIFRQAQRKHWASLILGLTAFGSTVLTFSSLESLQWAFLARQVDPNMDYGDMTETGRLLREGFINAFFDAGNLKALWVYPLGPIFMPLFGLSVLQFFRNLFPFQFDQKMFHQKAALGFMIIGSLLMHFLHTGYWYSWRFLYFNQVLILFLGFAYLAIQDLSQRFSSKALVGVLIWLTVFGSTGYYAIQEGLRLGNPWVQYYGWQHTWFDSISPEARVYH